MASMGGGGEEAKRLEILLRVGKEIASELNLERAVQVVTDAATELTGAAFGSFFYDARDAGSISRRDASGAFPMPRNTELFAPTFAGERLVRSDDIAKDARTGEGSAPVRSYLAVSVVSRSGEVVGGLFFGHPQPGRFTAEHEMLAEGIAAHAAIAIDNARLYRAAQDEIERRRKVE